MSPRRLANLAGELESAHGNTAVAITRDVSTSGLLVLTLLRLDVGSRVTLKVLIADQSLVVCGTVVRELLLDPEESTLWRTQVAITLDEADPVLARLLAALGDS